MFKTVRGAVNINYCLKLDTLCGHLKTVRGAVNINY